jgi:hypothetical protein
MDCGTWKREPCRPCTALNRRGGRVWMWVCRLHTDWTARGRPVHTAPHQPECHMWMWLTERTFGTFGSQGTRIWFSPDEMGNLGLLACNISRCPTHVEGFSHTQEISPVRRLSSKFLLTLLTRRSICSLVLFLGRKPNCSSVRNTLSFASRRTLAIRTFTKSLPTVSSRLMVLWEEGVHSRFLYENHAYLFPC